jgi:hypothetical protein
MREWWFINPSNIGRALSFLGSPPKETSNGEIESPKTASDTHGNLTPSAQAGALSRGLGSPHS